MVERWAFRKLPHPHPTPRTSRNGTNFIWKPKWRYFSVTDQAPCSNIAAIRNLTSSIALAPRFLRFVTTWMTINFTHTISPLFIMEKVFPHWRRRKFSYHLQDTTQEKSLCFQKEWQFCHYLLAIGFQLTYYNRLKLITIGLTLILLGEWYKNLHLESPAKKIIYLFSWDEIQAFSENSLGEL